MAAHDRGFEKAASLMEAPGRYVGRPILRLEDAPLLTGKGSFIDDIERPGQVHARIVRSEVAAGRISAIDVRPALRYPDVVAALTADDLPPGLRIPTRVAPTKEAKCALQPPLAREFVRYVGEPLAVIVASNPYAAEDAAEDVLIEIEELPAVTRATAAGSDSRAVHESLDTNVVHRERVHFGQDLDHVFATAHVVTSARLTVHRHSAVPLETRGLIAEYDDATGMLTMWGPTKVKHENRRLLAKMLDLPLERIRLIEPDVGGGFGPRGEFYPEDLLVPWLAIATGHPVKWVEDRREHFLAFNHSREQQCDINVAADAEGRLLGLRSTVWVDLGAYVRTNGPVLVLNTATHMPGPYHWDAFEVRVLGVLTNKTPAGTYRGPGQFEPALHRERMLDLIARRLHIDPWELRRRNLVSRDEMPYRIEDPTRPEPIVYDEGDFPLLWEQLGQRGGYRRLRNRARIARKRGALAGVGMSAFLEIGPRGPYEWAQVIPDADGMFTVYVGIASLGQGIATALSQIAADELGVPIDKVRVRHRDTNEIAEGGGAFSSRGVVFGGNAVIGAVRSLFGAARAAGAAALGLPDDELEVVAGGIVRQRGRPERARTFAELGCEGNYRFEKRTRGFSMGAALAAVEIDPETAAVRVSDCVVACDVGRAINPLIVRGQVVGAATQGIGGTLFEEFAYDERGQPVVTSFMDYCLPTAVEVPSIKALVLELPPHENPAHGVHIKGAGEIGIVGVGAAVANAIADAIADKDALLTDLPATPERMQALIDSTGSSPERG